VADRAPLATLRHELRTPLNAIIGYTEMLLEDSAPPDLVMELQDVRADGVRLLSSVDALLASATREGQGLAVSARLLEAELGRPTAAVVERGERLRERAVAAGLAETTADLDRILLAARRFQALLADLGAPWGVTSESLPEHGSADQQGRTGPSRGRGHQAATPHAAPGTLLVVEDSELNRDVLTRRLQREGHVVTAVANGREALEILQAQAFDLVLLDILLPEMDGYELLRRLKADAGLRDLPVIVISALDQIESTVRCIEMGAEDYLPKPFNPTLLRARVGACLEKKRLRDQEIAYLQSVAQVTQAAAALEAGGFEPRDLDGVAVRADALGQLARVFQLMAREVRAREERLARQVQELRIEVDEAKKARAVAEITTTDYFQNLQLRARQLRNRGKS
jgi:DNA-binding response OmpR family regulator